jgi:hypothetical protein
MAQPKLKIMLSSRGDNASILNQDGASVALSEFRKLIKKRLGAEKVAGKPIFDVWINEEEEGDGAENSWEECINQAERCDLFISIYNGHAGWQRDKSGIGICHAEYEAAHAQAPAKVRVLRLAKPAVKSEADKRFSSAIAKANSFDSFVSDDAKALEERVVVMARELLMKAAHAGCREFKQSGPNMGEALEWSRLNYARRASQIRQSLAGNLLDRASAKAASGIEAAAVVPLADEKVLFVCHAVPAAFGIAAAREMVGQPFLKDHEHIGAMGTRECVGPIHLIGCSKTVTENQAISLLGFPDAIIVTGAFGIYVADRIQKIQLCLIPNCRDASSTRHNVQRLFEWLEGSDELKDMVARAKSRRAIVNVTLDQME